MTGLGSQPQFMMLPQNKKLVFKSKKYGYLSHIRNLSLDNVNNEIKSYKFKSKNMDISIISAIYSLSKIAQQM